jgi:hypothetical protein
MWRALFYARELNHIRYEGSYKHRCLPAEPGARERRGAPCADLGRESAYLRLPGGGG